MVPSIGEALESHFSPRDVFLGPGGASWMGHCPCSRACPGQIQPCNKLALWVSGEDWSLSLHNHPCSVTFFSTFTVKKGEFLLFHLCEEAADGHMGLHVASGKTTGCITNVNLA